MAGLGYQDPNGILLLRNIWIWREELPPRLSGSANPKRPFHAGWRWVGIRNDIHPMMVALNWLELPFSTWGWDGEDWKESVLHGVSVANKKNAHHFLVALTQYLFPDVCLSKHGPGLGPFPQPSARKLGGGDMDWTKPWGGRGALRHCVWQQGAWVIPRKDQLWQAVQEQRVGQVWGLHGVYLQDLFTC